MTWSTVPDQRSGNFSVESIAALQTQQTQPSRSAISRHLPTAFRPLIARQFRHLERLDRRFLSLSFVSVSRGAFAVLAHLGEQNRRRRLNVVDHFGVKTTPQ